MAADASTPGGKMSFFKEQWSRKSIPVESDERMSPCDPEYNPHVCECSEQEGGMIRQRPTSSMSYRLPHDQYDVNTSARCHDLSDVSLEQPRSLRSTCGQSIPQRYQAQSQGGVPTGHRQCACSPLDHPHNIMRPPHQNTPLDLLQPRNAGQALPLQRPPPPIDVMHERSLNPGLGPGPVTREVRRTISLPEESRKVFITYSMDIAKEIIPFTTFLINQGFKPECDIFDTPIRRMGITKWMDSFLNDKSVLIIVAISPKYKKDVEGGGDDEHSQHTKYIHNQIQNEYIQQGCLNFRLVPVLFSNATKADAPSWMNNTRIYSWPSDNQDLVLRLLREERYIIPPPTLGVNVFIRPV